MKSMGSCAKVSKSNCITSNVIFIGNARCFHTMDWYRSAKEILFPKKVLFVTDLIQSEGHTKLVNQTDDLIHLYNIDWLLLPKQSKFGNIWRNFIKAIFLPIQVLRLKSLLRSFLHSSSLLFHAHTMYYMAICWLAGVNYIATPQGSEILVRPYRSNVYRYFAVMSLLAAKYVIVDSVNMQQGILELCGKESTVVQNGIDISAILNIIIGSVARKKIVSNRGIYPLYRIDQIIQGRASSSSESPLVFIYPMWEDNYKAKCFDRLESFDLDLGRLPKEKMYELLASTLLVISIPKSDSSPRSVYEAIFCGCCVAVTYNPWIESLPGCMRQRLHIVDLSDNHWFSKSIDYALAITKVPYVPSEAALNLFDQKKSMQLLSNSFYNVT